MDALRQGYLTRLNGTHLRSSDLRKYVELPAVLDGRSILDIGAGTSTASMDCKYRCRRVTNSDVHCLQLMKATDENGK